MSTTRLAIGRILRVFGIVLFMAGIGVCIGVLCGIFGAFPFAGVLAMIVGSATGWLGNSLAAGTLKREIKNTIEYERRESLRLRTHLRLRTAVSVVIGFAMFAVLFVIVWWLLAQNTT